MGLCHPVCVCVHIYIYLYKHSVRNLFEHIYMYRSKTILEGRDRMHACTDVCMCESKLCLQCACAFQMLQFFRSNMWTTQICVGCLLECKLMILHTNHKSLQLCHEDNPTSSLYSEMHIHVFISLCEPRIYMHMCMKMRVPTACTPPSVAFCEKRSCSVERGCCSGQHWRLHARLYLSLDLHHQRFAVSKRERERERERERARKRENVRKR